MTTGVSKRGASTACRGLSHSRARPGARFLWLTITAAAYGDLKPGTCTIRGGTPEPFDLLRYHLFFPIDHVSAYRLEVQFEMEGLGVGEQVIRAASLLH